MRITNLQESRSKAVVRLSADVTFRGDQKETIWIEWPVEAWEKSGSATIDPFVVMLLPMAGTLNETLISDEPIAEELYHNLLEAQAIFKSYSPQRYQITPLEVETVRRQKGWGYSASFFSGGVDSLYNLAEMDHRATTGHGAPIDLLWLLHGFDIPLDNLILWNEVWRQLSTTAAILGRELFWCRTNVKRDFYDKFVPYIELGFGAGLGGVAKSMANGTSRTYIGSWASYDKIFPHASTPLLDPMWSCESQDIIHFSCRVDRDQKIAALVERQDLLACLRVCYQNPEDRYNCGQCEKCLRTQMQLLILGAESKATTFVWPLEGKHLRKLRFPAIKSQRYVWDFWQSIRAQCADRKELQTYERSIGHAMIMSHLRKATGPARAFARLIIK